LLTLVVVALLARLPWGGEPAAGTARAIA